MKAELAGRVALVTGAGAKNGIGWATALCLADAGADVAVTDITLSPELEELASEVRSKGRRSAAIALNVMSSVEIHACVDAVARALGGINILVNNAGTTVGALPFLDISEADFDLSYFVNLRGPALLSQLCIPIMRAGGGGSIVNNVSTAGLGAEQGFGAYTASKHALIGVTKTIAAEFGAFNIRCNAVCPGYTATDMHLGVNQRLASEASVSVAEIARQRYAKIALLRAAEPSEVADAIVFLAGPRSAYITGVALPLAGGGPYGI